MGFVAVRCMQFRFLDNRVLPVLTIYFCLFQDEVELEQLLQADGQARELVRDLRQKVEEAKSSLSSNRSRGKVLDALMQQKRSGKISGILGRLVRTMCMYRLHQRCQPHSIMFAGFVFLHSIKT